jgi:hypothetical protein
MFYGSEDLKVVLPVDSLNGCNTLRDALREGFLLYFTELERHYNLVYRIRDLRFIADKGVGDLAYNISFKGQFPWSLKISLAEEVVSDIPLSLSVLEAGQQGLYRDLVQLVLNQFSISVLAFEQVQILNMLLEKYKPQGSPYLVQFRLNYFAKDRFLSDFREDLVEWCVTDEFPRKLQNRFSRDLGQAKEFIRKEFYKGFNSVSEALRGQSTLWSEDLAGQPPTGVTFNPSRLLKALAISLNRETSMRCKFAYEIEDSGIVVLFKKTGEVYREVLRFDIETGDIEDCDTSYELQEVGKKLEQVVLDESA